VVVRFSDAEFVLVRERAGLAGFAVGAWIGQASIETVELGTSRSIGLPDLLRLHADITLVAQLAGDDVEAEQVALLLGRLDAAVDLVVAELERRRR